MFTTLTGLAALSFSIGGYFMKLSAGLTHPPPDGIDVCLLFSRDSVANGRHAGRADGDYLHRCSGIRSHCRPCPEHGPTE